MSFQFCTSHAKYNIAMQKWGYKRIKNSQLSRTYCVGNMSGQDWSVFYHYYQGKYINSALYFPKKIRASFQGKHYISLNSTLYMRRTKTVKDPLLLTDLS